MLFMPMLFHSSQLANLLSSCWRTDHLSFSRYARPLLSFSHLFGRAPTGHLLTKYVYILPTSNSPSYFTPQTYARRTDLWLVVVVLCWNGVAGYLKGMHKIAGYLKGFLGYIYR